jgi:2-isopropylmalate synthase
MPKFQIFDELPPPGSSVLKASQSPEATIISVPQKYQLDYLSVISGTNQEATATVRMVVDGQVKRAASDGISGIDAVFNAISAILDKAPVIVFWSCPTIFHNRDSVAEFHVGFFLDHLKMSGNGYAKDMYEAAALAYIDGLNRLAVLIDEA